MGRRRWRVEVVVALVALALLVGCTGDVDRGAAGDEAAVPLATVDPDVVALAEARSSLDADWAEGRAAMVARLAEPSAAGTAEVAVPPELAAGLADCGDDWSDTGGLTDTRILVGLSVATTGPQGADRAVADGMAAYLDSVNRTGGVGGRAVELVVVDDQYQAPAAVAAIGQVLASEAPFLVSGVGTPGALAERSPLAAACVPQPFVGSSHPAFGDPVEFPLSSGFDRAITTEAILWGRWLERDQSAAGPLRVGVLAIDNDFGRTYLTGFEAWAEDHPDVVGSVVSTRQAPDEPDVAARLEELAAAESDVLIIATSGDACADAVAGSTPDRMPTVRARILASGCQGQVTSRLGPGAQGTVVIDGGVQSLTDPAMADQRFTAVARSDLVAAGLDPDDPRVVAGYGQYGWALVELLRVADALPGGLSRTNVALAARGLDLDHPLLADGIRFTMSGTDDAYPVEGGRVLAFQIDEDGWVPLGAPIDVNGATPVCRWERGRCS
ncbi:MAG: ABC transporter substrate-binding protein [Acidimicrobiales bacterium]